MHAKNTINFIQNINVPSKRNINYADYVCNHRPLKPETYWTILTVAVDCLDYEEYSASPAAELLDTKLIFKSTISDTDKETRFMS